MGKIAFVFSGQGDQYVGMGKDLYGKYPIARKIFDMCDSIRPGTLSQCFEGTEEQLVQTENTQPCLFAFELAAARVLTDMGVMPDAAAGFSLGEVTAATVSGVFDDETGFRLVCRRGTIMQRESKKYDTSMAAVVKLTSEKVCELCCRHSDVYPVNFNCPGQVTVSGLSSQMADFFADVKAAGGRAIPLKVKGAFHSPFMNDAARDFAKELDDVEIGDRNILLYSNITAMPYGDNVKALLSEQISSPVRWEMLIENMVADGVDTFIEIGPGRTLTNMIKKINPDVRAVNVTEYLEEAEQC